MTKTQKIICAIIALGVVGISVFIKFNYTDNSKNNKTNIESPDSSCNGGNGNTNSNNFSCNGRDVNINSNNK